MSRALSGGARLLAVAVALILAVGVLQPRLASAQPSIMLNPTFGTAGSVVNVTGSGFGQNETVNISFGAFGVVVSPTASGTNGSFATQFTVPAGATPAMYTVTATGATSHTSGTAQFQIITGPTTTLSISKGVTNPSTGVLSYQIHYANIGANAATGVVITDSLQPGQSLRVTSLSPGCTYRTSVGGVVTVTCTIGTVPVSPTAGSSGTVYFSTQINDAFTGTITNQAQISANNAATQVSNTTSVTVGSGNPGTTALRKLVEANNNGFFSTGVNANPGDVLTYDIAYINSSVTTTAPSVTVADTLQPGQTYLGPPFSSSNCVQVTLNTISCSLGDVPPNTRVDTFISASVNSNTPGTIITNQAQATSGGVTIFSNSTTVQIAGTTPPPCTSGCCNVVNHCCVTSCVFNGNFVLCGLVNFYNGSSITVNGVTVAILPGASLIGPVTVGSNQCITFNLNSAAQATSLAVSSNLAGVAVACGFYGGTSASGVLNVSGIGIPLAGGASLQPVLVLGQLYCFLLNSSGQATGVLSSIPTSLLDASAAGGSQSGYEKAE
jgi:uncharacterized repeat protein (TIGR01451 family)